MRNFFILLFIPSVFFAQFRVGGYFQNDLLYSDGQYFNADVMNISQLKVDLNYRDQQWRLVGDFRINMIYSLHQQPDAFLLTQNAQNHLALDVDIPRLYIRINSDQAGSFTLGRSYLTFGVSQPFNSLEWFKTFSLSDPTATKPGVNMISWDIGIGSFSKFKAFLGAEDSWDAPIGGAEFIVGASSIEMSFAYQRKGNNLNVLGSSFKWDMGITLFGTYAAHLNDVLSRNTFNHFHEFSLGLDYSIPIDTMSLLLGQIFYYNSSGARYYQDFPSILAQERDFYFLSYAYSYTTIKFVVSEFFNIGADIVVSFLDGSGMVLPKFSSILVNNVALDVLLGLPWGDHESEFGVKNDRSPEVTLQMRVRASF